MKHRDKTGIKKTPATGFINRLVSIGTHKIGHKLILGNHFPHINTRVYNTGMYGVYNTRERNASAAVNYRGREYLNIKT